MSFHLLSRLKSPWVLLVVAACLAGGVSYIAYTYLQQREERIRAELAESVTRGQTPKSAVVVPREDAPVGTMLEQGAFVSREIEQDLVYPDTVMVSDFDTVRGQRLARPVQRGRPLRLTDLQMPEVSDVASVLPVGSRAVTLDVDNLNSIAHTLRPGHRVDVFLLSKAEKTKDADTPEALLNQATLFMQDLMVLATGQEFQDVAGEHADRLTKMVRPGDVEGASGQGFDTITLLVSPKEAARLLVAQKLGNFRVVLRGRADRAAVALRATTGADVLPGSAGRDGGVEFIVGGKGDGSAALAASVMPLGLPSPGEALPQWSAGSHTPDAVAHAPSEMPMPRSRLGVRGLPDRSTSAR